MKTAIIMGITKSIIFCVITARSSAFGSKEYMRVRFGIGRPPGRQDPADFVLKPFSAAERKELPLILDRAADAVASLLTDGLGLTQNRFN